MNKILKLLPIFFILITLFVSCSKKPLTLDNETSMKTLLKASDAEITELIKKEANEKGDWRSITVFCFFYPWSRYYMACFSQKDRPRV